jgi:hypothetical protein
MTNTRTTNTMHYFGTLTVLAAMLVAMLAAMVVASGVALAATTAFSNSSPIQIVDDSKVSVDPANPYPSQINVQGLSGSISDVDLKLNGVTTKPLRT